jgi:HSP20 family protein
MAMKSLLPPLWKKGETPSKARREHPFYSLQREMNRLFDDFFRGFDLEPFATMEIDMPVLPPPRCAGK